MLRAPKTYRCAFAIILAVCAGAARGTVILQPAMQTFGNALKSFQVQGGQEQLLFQFSQEPVAGNTAPHVVTEQWFSLFGGPRAAYEPNTDARIRVYVDGETEASVDFQLFFAHTVGVQNCVDSRCSDTRVPWASSEVQHMAHAGALKNRYRIPFTRSVRITATLPYHGVVYYYCRGMTHLPVVVGDLQLPDAARLRLHKNWNITVAPLSQLSLVPHRTNSSGLLYATIWSAESEFIGFMEGTAAERCVWVRADGHFPIRFRCVLGLYYTTNSLPTVTGTAIPAVVPACLLWLRVSFRQPCATHLSPRASHTVSLLFIPGRRQGVSALPWMASRYC